MVSPTETPLVSVVLPTCNRRSILADSLEALARQTYPRFEIIVIDDCSTDGTGDFLKAFATGHPDLTMQGLRNEHNLGANASRNRGIQAAQGDYVAFIDSDCIAEPDWLAQLMAGFVHRRVAAVSGLVTDAPIRNIYELTFKGTHRLHRSGLAHRLIGGNMCVRRELLMKHRWDEDRGLPVKNVDRCERPVGSEPGEAPEPCPRPSASEVSRAPVEVCGCDEEGLSLRLRAAGHELRSVPQAVVLHKHSLDRKALMLQAWRGGRSAARLVYKYYLSPRLDLLPFLLAYSTVPLVLVRASLVAVPLFFFLGALMAITYNDLARKGKTRWETARSFPVLVAYYHLRLTGYVWETARLRVSRHDLQRVCLRDIPSDFPAAAAPRPR